MSVKNILLFDLDGTLLTSNKLITNATKEMLNNCQKQGHIVVLASGRPLSGILQFAKELDLNKYPSYIIAYNGSLLYDLQREKAIYETILKQEEIKEILEHCKKFKVTTMVDHQSKMYVSDIKGYNVDYEAKGNALELCYIEDLIDFITFPAKKVLTSGKPDYMKEIFEQLKEPFSDKYNVMFTSAIYIEFNPLGVDKGDTLNHLCRYLNVDKNDCIAFGDGYNDISLLKSVKTSVCMGNGVDALKSVASFITKTNDEDGVVFALKMLGF